MAVLNGEILIEGSYFEHLEEQLHEDSDDSDNDDNDSICNAHEDTRGCHLSCSVWSCSVWWLFGGGRMTGQGLRKVECL